MHYLQQKKNFVKSILVSLIFHVTLFWYCTYWPVEVPLGSWCEYGEKDSVIFSIKMCVTRKLSN